jgi:hypothetical protein
MAMTRLRAGLLAAACAVLSACEAQTPATPDGTLPPSSIAGPEDPFWKGAFAPISGDTEAGPGDLTFAFAGFGQPGAITFSRGLVLQTRPISQPSPGAGYSREGEETWAHLLALPANGQAEVRQVSSEAGPAGAPAGLCGSEPTTYVAIGIRPGIDHPGSVSIAAFAGAEAPSPGARDSKVCSVFEYAIPG